MAVLGSVAGVSGPVRAASIIDFDDVPAPGLFIQVTPGGVDGPVYSRSGVTFDGGVVLNGDAGGFAPPPSTPPNLYATTTIDTLADGSSLPGMITASLAPPLVGDSVSLFVGNSGLDFASHTYTLTAFDANSQSLGSDSITLGFELGGTLSLTAPGFASFTVTSDQAANQKNFFIDTVDVSEIVPEPSTFIEAATGILMLLGYAWWCRQAKALA
jgi:hypothetical protein